jgi:hypothetical protein
VQIFVSQTFSFEASLEDTPSGTSMTWLAGFARCADLYLWDLVAKSFTQRRTFYLGMDVVVIVKVVNVVEVVVAEVCHEASKYSLTSAGNKT